MTTVSERISAARQKALEKKYELEGRSPEMSNAGVIGLLILLGGVFVAGLSLGYFLWVIL
jgi:hypothetical protein